MIKYLGLLRKRALLGGLLASLALLVSLLSALPVKADGGIGISGSFYQQPFEIPPGSSISGPDIYVVVFNNSSDQIKVNMTSLVPSGVSLVMSQSDFTLPAHEQQKVLVGVEVGADVVPDEYEISIAAEPYKEISGGGIELLGAASQKANLIVTGEYGTVSVQATSPDQQPIMATVRLYRVVSGHQYEVAYSEDGTLETKVVPGTFIAASFLGGVKLAEEQFDVADGENKEIILSGATMYCEGFGIVPNYYKDSGRLAFVQIVYTVRNLYQRVDNCEVILQVSCNGASLAEISLANLNPLETGRVDLNSRYTPDGGWVNGSYDFQLQLYQDGKPYTSSALEPLTVSGESSGGVSPYVIGGIAAAAIVLAGIGLFFVMKKRRR